MRPQMSILFLEVNMVKMIKDFFKELWNTVVFDIKSAFHAIPQIFIAVCGTLLGAVLIAFPFFLTVFVEKCFHYDISPETLIFSQIGWWLIVILVLQTTDRISKKKKRNTLDINYRAMVNYSLRDTANSHGFGYGVTSNPATLVSYFCDGVRFILETQYCIGQFGRFVKHVKVILCKKKDLNGVRPSLSFLNHPIKELPTGKELKSCCDLDDLKRNQELIDTITEGDWIAVIINGELLAGYVEIEEAPDV